MYTLGENLLKRTTTYEVQSINSHLSYVMKVVYNDLKDEAAYMFQEIMKFRKAKKSSAIGELTESFIYPVHNNYVGRPSGNVTILLQPFYAKGSMGVFICKNSLLGPTERECIHNTLNEKRLLKWIRDLCNGLQTLHDCGLVHRNIQ